jgi:hypothetical protein
VAGVALDPFDEAAVTAALDAIAAILGVRMALSPVEPIVQLLRIARKITGQVDATVELHGLCLDDAAREQLEMSIMNALAGFQAVGANLAATVAEIAGVDHGEVLRAVEVHLDEARGQLAA